MEYKKFNITKPTKYVDKGVEKTRWTQIGTYTEFYKPDGSISRLVEIPAISLEAQIFPMDLPKGTEEAIEQDYSQDPEIDDVPTIQTEELLPGDIPF